MKLTVKFHDTLIPLSPSIPVNGAEEWEVSMLQESAKDYCTDAEYADLIRAVKSRAVWTNGKVRTEISHRNFQPQYSIWKIHSGIKEIIEVADVKSAHETCKALSVRQDGSICGVTLMLSGKRTRVGAPGSEWDGQVDTCGTHNPFTDEYMAQSLAVVATLNSHVLSAYITE